MHLLPEWPTEARSHDGGNAKGNLLREFGPLITGDMIFWLTIIDDRAVVKDMFRSIDHSTTVLAGPIAHLYSLHLELMHVALSGYVVIHSGFLSGKAVGYLLYDLAVNALVIMET